MLNKFIPLLLLCASCSSADQRIEKKRMNNNKTIEKIYRLSEEKVYLHEELKLCKRELYPWENESEFPKITIDHFRCRGNLNNKERHALGQTFQDCKGLYEHGLPYVDGEEFVFPALLSILNKLQNRLEKKINITSGHRCPKHNSYVTLGTSKLTRFMIGAKVEFYIEGMEKNPQNGIEAIIDLYKLDTEKYANFEKIRKDDGSFKWQNKEIALSIEQKGEHSVLDNLNHPVISIEILFDREKNESVILDWNKAYKGFILH
jgi:hypothetical protein